MINFFEGKKILITGHTGFKGTWLLFMLNSLKAELYGYSLPLNDKDNELFIQSNANSIVKSYFGDISQQSSIQSVLDEVQPDIVIHLAAQALVPKSFLNPIETFSVNVLGTANLLESSRKCKSVKSVLCITTDKVYKNNEWLWKYREIDELGGESDPYSASKACAEFVIDSYRKNHHFLLGSNNNSQIITARGGNVLGGGDFSERRLMPDIYRAHKNNSKIEIRSPHSIRPWQHVLDVLFGYLKLVRFCSNNSENFYIDKTKHCWNFGPDDLESKTTKDVVNAAKLYGLSPFVSIVENNISESGVLELDSSKSKKYLDWHNYLNFEETIKITCEWYLDYLSNKNTSTIMKKQVNNYMKLCE
jgi:CDP-glucose 4,6-dehydratase